MGMHLEHRCAGCGYTTTVSGRRDFGFAAVTETMACADCREVTDVLVEQTALFEKPAGPVAPSCRRCGADEAALTLWRSGDPCPRCGRPLPAGRIVAHWD